MEHFVRIVKQISQLCGIIAAALIALAVLVVCHMVFVRYVLNYSTIWQTDFVTYSLVAATFIGSPYLLLTRGHVNVDVLPLYLPARPRFWLAAASITMTFAFAAVMAVLTFHLFFEAWQNGWRSDSMWRARLWIPYSSMPIGLGLLALQSVSDFYNLITRREEPFGMKPIEVESQIV